MAAAPSSKGLKITQFYASSGELIKGERAIACYGVENASMVRIEPAVEKLSPSLARCFWTAPDHDTTYTLHATGEGGDATASFTVKVSPPPPFIHMMALSGREVKRGETFTLCYGMQDAKSARLEPVGLSLPPLERSCIKLSASTTTNYTIVATGEGGRTDRARFTIKVK